VWSNVIFFFLEMVQCDVVSILRVLKSGVFVSLESHILLNSL